MGRLSRLIAAPLLLALAAPVLAQDEYGDGRVRYVEPGVLVQRAGESQVEEAVVNLPFLPGDRIWSDQAGRAELQFQGAALVRLDSRGKLDYLSHDAGRRNDRILLRLWAGGLYFHVRDDSWRPDFELETPGGLVELLDSGVYRVDVESGETRLSVLEGEAAIDSGGRRVRVDAGERTYARGGEEPEPPAPFDLYEADEFALWDRDREERLAMAAEGQSYLPEDVGYYGGELESAGSWYYESEIGHVWRPYVTAGWLPYSNGHWVWTVYGWTWVPYETWGWVTHHYGRWGYSPVLGWYWIPGRTWGPAWVSWAVGGDYIGWCALGHRDRPVSPPLRVKGHAVPRGSLTVGADSTAAAAPGAGQNWSGFTFVRKSDMGTRRLAERRFAVQGDVAEALRVADSPRALTRELKLGEAAPAAAPAAAARTIKTRPSFGDTVPELRGDPATTIPIPTQRRRDRDAELQRNNLRPEAGSRPTDLRSPREAAPAARPRGSDDAWRSRVAPETSTHPTDRRSPREVAPAAPARERGSAAPLAPRAQPQDPPSRSWAPRATTPRDEPATLRRSEPSERREPVPDVLRRFFQPANEGRSRPEAGSVPRSQPRPATPQRVEPRGAAPQRVEPRRSTPPPSSSRARPKKEKND